MNPAPSLRHQRVVTLLCHRLETYLERYPGEVGVAWSGITTLLLAAEVASPSSVKADRVIKRRLYQERGVATYWVIDADAELLEVWHPGDERPEIVTDVLRWRVAQDAEELVIDLEAFFGALPR